MYLCARVVAGVNVFGLLFVCVCVENVFVHAGSSVNIAASQGLLMTAIITG